MLTISRNLINLTKTPLYSYFINNMLQSKFQPQQINIQSNLYHLYISKLIRSSFCQRFLANMTINCYRTNQQQIYLHQIINFTLQNLQKIENKATIILVLNQIYHYQYKNKDIIHRLIEKAFNVQFIIDNDHYMYELKFVILINALIGLDKYPQKYYKRIEFKKFKPISICMVIQLFYNAQLQNKYPFVDELIDMVIACQEFIPFADMHHLNYVIRKVDSPKFKEFFFRLRRKFQQVIKKTYEQKNKNDIYDKIWMTDDDILKMFRQRIEDKYKII